MKNIDQKCLQSKIILPNNEKIGILLNDKLTKKGKWIIGQKGKLPENMRSLSSATTDIECANGLLLRRSIWRDQARFRLFWSLQRHQLAGRLDLMKAAGLRAPRYLEWVNFESEIPCIFSPLW
ncbi:hypothetical protein [Methanothrix soehngenii]|uniref:hypothetical protein n=1 Tax=Methanothrix soehngenii TaxID=2223 RepID=UPI00300D2EB6